MTADDLHARGVAHWQAGNREAALDSLRRAIALAPDVAAYRNTLGAVLASAGDLPGGLRLFRSALALLPAESSWWLNVGHVLRGRSAAETHRAYARAAVAEGPSTKTARAALAGFIADTQNDRGIALFQGNDLAGALAAFDLALRSDPLHLSALVNSALTLQRLGRGEAARRRYRRALTLDPGNAEAQSNLAGLDQNEFDHAGAVRRHRRAVAIKRSPSLHSSLILSLCYWDAVTNEALFAETRRWEAIHARPVYPSVPPPRNDRSPDRPLRLGWCSIDFSNHPVGRNVVGLFERLDRRALTSIIYGDLRQPDPVTERFRLTAEAWRETKGLADAQVAEMIRADRIDILMMVAGHTHGNRISVAAHKPAPLQVSLHDVVTSGLAVMDGWLTDPVLHPETTTERFTERLVRLPCFYLHEAPGGSLNPDPRPAPAGVTFGSMNNPQKYNDAVFDAWARILLAVPNARLLLKYVNAFESPTLRRLVLDAFARRGVSGGRIHFASGHLAPHEHLSILQQVDIALDPFPFNGSTTTFEALWMGIPIVTLAGDRFLSRVGASCLTQIGLTDLVAGDADGYVDRAVALARDASRLGSLRQTLRARVAASPLCDAEAHAQALGRVLRALWREWCRQEP